MVEKDHPQSNPGVIEALKAATRQVVQLAPDNEPKQKPQSTPASVLSSFGEAKPVFENFAEAFIKKITSVEQEKAKIEQEQLVVDQELSRVEKLQTDLFEKKKQLENRRNELIQVKDKLTALDKEINKLLKSPSL